MSSDSNKEYSVNWKNHMSHVRNAFDHLLNKNELTDVTLWCEGKKIGAHKMLLSACSTYFRDTFKEVPCQHPVIILYGVEYSVLSDILHFIYRGEVSVDTTKLDTFLKTAQLLQISGLTDNASDKLIPESDTNTEVANSDQTVEESYKIEQTVQTSSGSDEVRKGNKRLKVREVEAPREKIQRPENDTLFISDVKCEPSELINFEDPLEDPLLQSEQSNDTRDLFTNTNQEEEEFKIQLEGVSEFQRFGDSAPAKKVIPLNTLKSRATYWTAFENFCSTRNYTLNESTNTEEISNILADYAVNMRKIDGTDYKEGVVKVIWNTTANMIQEMYYDKYKIKFDPFRDVEFKKARDARDMKRRQLKSCPDKRKIRLATLDEVERYRLYSVWDEETPSGLQRKFFHIAAFELSWSSQEAANCLINSFREEYDTTGIPTGRIEYNPTFGSSEEESHSFGASKWLVTNVANTYICPVRLLRKLLSKRKTDCTIKRLFLTPNPNWNKSETSCWFKECPVGRNQIALWIKEGAERIGIDTKRFKITHFRKSRMSQNIFK